VVAVMGESALIAASYFVFRLRDVWIELELKMRNRARTV